MASFTEQATLKVVDQSSAKLRKINAELKKLFATAKSLKNVNIKIGVNATGAAKATAELRKLNAEINKLKAATRSVKLSVNAGGVSAASAQLAKLRAQASRPIVIRTTHTGGGGAQQPPRPPRGAVPRAYSNTRTPMQAAIGGFAGGLGAGLGRLNESFGALAAAAYLAARALKSIAGETYKAERADLAVKSLTSPLQQKLFQEMDKQKGAPPGMLKHRKWEFDFARASFAGDVGNSQDLLDAVNKPGNKKILSQPEAQAERARRADVLARELFENVAPGLYARDPNMSPEESLENQRKFVQAMGISTTEMFKNQTAAERAAGKAPELSKDALDAMQGFRKAQQIDPSINAGMIRTAMANVKSLGITMSPDAITEVLVNMGTKGIRAANEAYRGYLLGTGAVDVKKVNEVLNELGLFEPDSVKRNKPSPGFPKGSIKANELIPKTFYDADGQPIDIGTRPAELWRAAYEAEGGIKQAVQKRNAEQAKAKTKREGGSAAAVKAAGDAALRAVPTEPQIAEYLQTKLSGANRSGIQGVIDAILGKNILASQFGQADSAADPKTINELISKNVAASADNFMTALLQAFGDVGQKVADKIDLNTILQNLTTKMAENPGMTTAIAAFGGLAAVGLAAAVSTLLVAPFTSLTAAGVELQAAAAALMRAAGIDALGGGVPGGPGGGKPGTPMPGGKRTIGQLIKDYGAAAVMGAIATGKWVLRNPGKATGAGIAAGIAYEVIVNLPDDPKAAREKLENDERLKDAKRQLQNTKTLEKILEGGSGEYNARALQQARDQIKALTEEIERREAKPAEPEVKPPEAKPPEEKPKTETEQATIATAAALKAIEAAKAGGVPGLVPTPTPTPTTAAGAAAVAPPADSLAVLIPQLAKSSESITLAVSSLTTAGTTFSTVFTNGATAISTAGQTAASTLTNAAPSIGAAIGKAAAAAISAATAQVSINVNQKSEAPNTGGSKAQ